MPGTEVTRYRCGCSRVGWDWTLCEDCSSRIGDYGTCLQCSGPANEQWAHPDLPGESYCSRECAGRAAYEARHAR